MGLPQAMAGAGSRCGTTKRLPCHGPAPVRWRRWPGCRKDDTTMRNMLNRAAVAALVLGAFGGAGTESKAQYSRRTPIVEAVQKTRKSIITIKVEKRGAYTRREIVGTGVIVDER